jgi:hypothetical protein
MMEITLAILAECTRGSHAYRNHRRGNDWFDIGEIVERGWTRGAPGVTSSRAEQPAGSAGWAAAMFPEARWGSKRSTPSTSRRFRVRRTAAGNASAYLAIRWSPMARELWSGCKSPQPCPSSVDDDRRDLVRLCGWILKSQGVERATEALSVRALKRLAQNVAGDLGSASLPSAPATLHPMARR